MEMILMDLLCWFCGNKFQSEMPEKWSKRVFTGCRRCYIDTRLKSGAKVIYAGFDRGYSKNADEILERDKTYTIQKVTQWQHGCYLTLKETGSNEFDHKLFAPGDFDLSLRVCAITDDEFKPKS